MAKGTCSTEGCESPNHARGLCSRCYDKAKYKGQLPPKRQRGWSIMDTGYVRVWAPGHPTANADGYALEHRKVAWDGGVLTDLTLHVHHINEIKVDNRLENLAALPEGQHHSDHVQASGCVTNQFGTWPLLTPDEKRMAETVRHRAVAAHIRARSEPRECELCGAEFLPFYKQRFCSQLCARRWTSQWRRRAKA